MTRSDPAQIADPAIGDLSGLYCPRCTKCNNNEECTYYHTGLH